MRPSSSERRSEREDTDFGLLGKDTFWESIGDGVIDCSKTSATLSSCSADDALLERSIGIGLIVDLRLLPLPRRSSTDRGTESLFGRSASSTVSCSVLKGLDVVREDSGRSLIDLVVVGSRVRKNVVGPDGGRSGKVEVSDNFRCLSSRGSVGRMLDDQDHIKYTGMKRAA